MKSEYQGLGGWWGKKIDQGSIKCKEKFRKSDFVSEPEDQGLKQMIGDWVDIFEQSIVGSRQSGSAMCEIRIPGTGRVLGRED